ncbi:MAG TPA: hypothetical protein VFB62_27085 [Polyangiaceae bacterium]|jgi:hypothetical protein|nr:hypothetical protein [Polyangiaceae bacterium]
MNLLRVNRVLGLGALVALVGCSVNIDGDALDEDDLATECSELSDGNVDAVADARVRALMEASIEFTAVSKTMRDEVFAACSNIALDLGAADTWSGIEDANQRIHNGSGTGACDVASREVAVIMDAAAAADITIALAITRGACHPDFETQVQCELGCTANTQCSPGTIETRCEPGDLSVVCDAECSAEAFCEGTQELPANCMGKCESECQGECKGSCVAQDGTVTIDNPNCHGKCSSSCNGMCRGLCKEEQPVQCGASVSCRGGCTSTFTEPKCVDEFTPPSCTIDADCFAACSAKATANAVCEPTRVDVFVDVNAMADGKLQILATTLETNLSRLVTAAEAQGKLAVQVVGKLAASAEAVATDIDDLDGKSLVCAAAVVEATVEASISIQASFEGSVAVVDSCTSRSM